MTIQINKLHSNDPNTKGLNHFRTDGLGLYGLPELEVLLPIRESEAQELLYPLIEENLKGTSITDGKMIKGLTRYPIFLFQVSDSPITLRAVFSDTYRAFPWEPNCEDSYKQQITFNTDKVFYLVTQNKSRVKELRKSLMLRQIAPHFKKRADGYISPTQYIVNNELFNTGPTSLKHSLAAYVEEVAGIFEIYDLTIICKDTDYSDPINKYFKAYKEKYLK